MTEFSWDDLEEVSLVTTAAGGPVEQDVLFVLVGGSGSQVVSMSDPSAQALLARLQSLPGFRNEVLIEGLEATVADRFVLWSRTPQG